ncbi:glycosyltransferase family 4 protein [Serratia fonticola]
MANEIIIFARSLPFHHIGGMEVVAWDMAVVLASKGYCVKIVTTPYESSECNLIPLGVEIIIAKDALPGKYSRSWWKATEKIMQTFEPKSVKAIISISAAGFHVLKFKKQYPNTKFIMQAHGTSWGEFISKWKRPGIKQCLSSIKNIVGFVKDAFFYRKFDFIVAIGSAVEEGMKQIPTKYIIDIDKVIKIENGIDNKLFTDDLSSRNKMRKELNIPEDAMVLLSISRLHDQKGVDNNIHAFKHVLDSCENSYYLICGSGGEINKLEELVREYGISNRVIFMGAKTRSDLAKIMCCSDVFVFLTKRVEGLPLNILEAMSSGLPIVISEHLTFVESERIRKNISSDYKKAASNIFEIAKYGRFPNRKSYINYKNTLEASIIEYIKLF